MVAIKEATYRDIPAIAQVHVDTWRSTYSGIVPNKILAELSYERREQAWQKVFENASESGGFTYLAEDQCSRVIGFVDGGKERTGNQNYEGEINAIYILQSYQHQSIGSELVRQAVARLSQMDIHSMLTWVLEDNPACSFYESLGGQKIQSKNIAMKGHQLIELAYGWTDTSVLSETFQ